MLLVRALWFWPVSFLQCVVIGAPLGEDVDDTGIIANPVPEDFYRSRQYTANRDLVRAYLTTMDDLRVETWLMHNALLGWWWGKKLLPWDSSLSMQVSEPDMFFLAAYHNMSTFSLRSRDTRNRRRYLLDISPHATDRERTSQLRSADARWIDTATGLSLDVYAVRYNLTHPRGQGVLSCSDGSEIADSYLFPLIDTTFERVPAKIPHRYGELLGTEYGAEAMTLTEQNGHRFDENKRQWIVSEREEIPGLGVGDAAEKRLGGDSDEDL